MSCDQRYHSRPYDILVHTVSLPAQRLYRVLGVHLGGLKEEGYIEVESLGYADQERLRIPPLLLDDAVERGVMQCIWRADP